MIPTLIVGGSLEARDMKLAAFLEDKRVLEKLEGAKEAIKLEEVRHLLEHLSLKFNVSDNVALVIAEAQELTLVAQNALLKSLEELPETVSFFLTADRETSLLPTITSRCRLIKIKDEEVNLTTDEVGEMKEIFKLVAENDIGSLLTVAEQWQKSGEVKKKLVILRQFLLEHSRNNPHSKRATAIRLVLECSSDLGRNINAQLALEHLFFELIALVG